MAANPLLCNMLWVTSHALLLLRIHTVDECKARKASVIWKWTCRPGSKDTSLGLVKVTAIFLAAHASIFPHHILLSPPFPLHATIPYLAFLFYHADRSGCKQCVFLDDVATCYHQEL